jgi:hypothetical protein
VCRAAKFGDWGARQDIACQNVCLRSMNVRLEFVGREVNLILGDCSSWQVLTAMQDNGVAGAEINDEDIRVTLNAH